MFSNNVSISVDGTDHDFGLISVKDSKSLRSDGSRENGEPDYLTIAHSLTGKGDKKVKRHLVRIDTTERSTVDGTSLDATVSAYVVLVVPEKGVTKDDAKLAYKKVVSFLDSTEAGAALSNIDRFLAQEP